MKIAIVGAGAMGSTYAGILGGGNEVWAVDVWAEHVEAIRSHGLTVEGANGKRTVRINATSDPEEVGVCDLVVISTKAFDVESAAAGVRPLVGPETLVLSIQNGLGSAERIAAVLGWERVALGIAAGFGASVVRPGHVHHTGWGLVSLGELRGPATDRIRRVARVWAEGGFNVQVADDADRLVWEKLICNVCFSGACTILERTIGEVLDDAEAWHVAAASASEAYEVAVASRIGLGFDDPVAYVRAFGERIRGARPSMLLDVLAGRRCEIDVINGAIPPAAREVGLAAPVNETVSALVKVKNRLD